MREQVIDWLKQEVPPARLRHILGVEQMAIELAKTHELNQLKAAQAGLMHDLAKYFKPQRLLQMAQQNGVEVDAICDNNPHLLHADVSAIVAQQQFKIKDQEILEAIRNHTLGRPEMSKLSCVIFVADALEPNRGETPQLDKMREVSFTNLYKSVWQTCDYSLKYLLDTRRSIHPRAILTRNWALQKASKKNN